MKIFIIIFNLDKLLNVGICNLWYYNIIIWHHYSQNVDVFNNFCTKSIAVFQYH